MFAFLVFRVESKRGSGKDEYLFHRVRDTSKHIDSTIEQELLPLD